MALGGTLYTTRLEPFWLKLERISVPIAGLPPAFDGYRIVQLTDLHLHDDLSRQVIHQAIEMALDRSPDLIALTGDYVTHSVNDQALYEELHLLSGPDGVWTSLGNHDHWTNAESVRQVLTDAGIAELRNDSTPISRDGQTIWLAGVDDIWEQHHDLNRALLNIPPGQTTILLAHEPDYADEVYPTKRVALQLSGHSHGGQVRVPLYGAPMLPYLGQKYPYGLRKLGAMWLYTSRGIGYLWQIRFNCRPEVTEITLVRA